MKYVIFPLVSIYVLMIRVCDISYCTDYLCWTRFDNTIGFPTFYQGKLVP